MSTQRGSDKRTRPQKHKNKTTFKNTLHDTSHNTKFINSIQVSDVCLRCKEIIEWKIKYKKYKPLTQPKKCVRCEQRTVRSAYHVMCLDCGRKLGVCTKCCQAKELVVVPEKKEQLKLDGELQKLLQSLPERKRRSFIRFMDKQKEKKDDNGEAVEELTKDDLKSKLEALKINTNDDDDDDDDFFDDEEED